MKEGALLEHSLTDKLGSQMADFIANASDPNERGRLTRKCLPHEDYGRAVFFVVMEIETTFSQLRQAMVLLSSFRSTKKLKEHGINRFDHVIYHLENFHLRITRCFDQCLILTNVVLDLGNEPDDCTYNLVRKNKHVKASGILGHLGELNRVVKPYRKKRNLIAHRARLYSDDLRTVEMLNLVSRSRDDIVPKHRLKYEMDWAHLAP